MMRRREFIAGIGSAAAWPVVARAQQGERMRRVGFLSVGDGTGNPNLAFALQEELAKLGWVEGRNLRLDFRFGANDEARIRAYAAELVGLAPDLIVCSGGAATRAVQGQTQMIPIVILGAGDIFTNGFVKDLAHPEGNTTGISKLFNSLGSKWVELLKEAVPQLRRVGFIYNAQLGDRQSVSPAINEASRALTVQATTISFRDAVDLVHGIDAFAGEPDGGLITTPAVSLMERQSVYHFEIGGCRMLATKPCASGSATCTNTTGTVLVACRTAVRLTVEAARITSGISLINCAT